MKTYFFALGTNHTLSKIDIVNILDKEGVDFEIVEASEEILMISTTVELEAEVLMNELGSAAKIGEIFGIYEKDNWPGGFLARQNLQSKFSRVKEKFGISVYGAGGKFKELNEVFYSRSMVSEKLRDLGNLREVREQGRVLSTVAVDKNGLLKNGFEVVICVGSKGIYIGKTLAIQDYESYSLRDYGRPRRDAKSGMTPPKLVKMMINLAEKKKESVFLDPFCGSGTFLQELLLLGYKNIIGADVEEKAIEDSRTNIEWLRRRFLTPLSGVRNDTKVTLMKSDVRKLSSNISPKTIDAIVTEPYLGSEKRKFFRPEQIKKELNQIEDLYLTAFQEFKKILKDNGAVVIIFPVFRYKNQFFYLQILDKISSLGFKSGNFFTKDIKGAEFLKLQITDRNSVIFFRPGQDVSREIFVFTAG